MRIHQGESLHSFRQRESERYQEYRSIVNDSSATYYNENTGAVQTAVYTPYGNGWLRIAPTIVYPAQDNARTVISCTSAYDFDTDESPAQPAPLMITAHRTTHLPDPEFAVLQENLARQLALLKPYIMSKPSLPVLGNVCIVGIDSALELTATNLKEAKTVLCPGRAGYIDYSDQMDKFAITVPYRTLCDLIAVLPPERIDLSVDLSTHTLTITCGRAIAHLKGISADEFPLQRSNLDECLHIGTIEGNRIAELKALVEFASNGVLVESNRLGHMNNLALLGYNLAFAGDRLIVTAANGYVVYTGTMQGLKFAPYDCIVVSALYSAINGLSAESWDNVELYVMPPKYNQGYGHKGFNDGQLKIIQGTATTTLQLIDSKFPDLETIETGYTLGYRGTVQARELYHALKSCKSEYLALDAFYGMNTASGYSTALSYTNGNYESAIEVHTALASMVWQESSYGKWTSANFESTLALKYTTALLKTAITALAGTDATKPYPKTQKQAMEPKRESDRARRKREALEASQGIVAPITSAPQTIVLDLASNQRMTVLRTSALPQYTIMLMAAGNGEQLGANRESIELAKQKQDQDSALVDFRLWDHEHQTAGFKPRANSLDRHCEYVQDDSKAYASYQRESMFYVDTMEQLYRQCGLNPQRHGDQLYNELPNGDRVPLGTASKLPAKRTTKLPIGNTGDMPVKMPRRGGPYQSRATSQYGGTPPRKVTKRERYRMQDSARSQQAWNSTMRDHGADIAAEQDQRDKEASKPVPYTSEQVDSALEKINAFQPITPERIAAHIAERDNGTSDIGAQSYARALRASIPALQAERKELDDLELSEAGKQHQAERAERAKQFSKEPGKRPNYYGTGKALSPAALALLGKIKRGGYDPINLMVASALLKRGYIVKRGLPGKPTTVNDYKITNNGLLVYASATTRVDD